MIFEMGAWFDILIINRPDRVSCTKQKVMMNSKLNGIGPLQVDTSSGISFRVRYPVPLLPSKCVLLLHGVGGNEANLLDLASDIDVDTLVVFPRALLQMGPEQFAWFRVAFTSDGPRIVPEEAETSRQALIRLVTELQKSYGIDAHRMVIAGFSQGGILSASVALTAPEYVGGFGVLSGRILPELKPILAAKKRLATLQGFIGHGELDSTLPVTWAQRSDQLLDELGVKHVLHLYPIGHGISAEMHFDFTEWVRTFD